MYVYTLNAKNNPHIIVVYTYCFTVVPVLQFTFVRSMVVFCM